MERTRTTRSAAADSPVTAVVEKVADLEGVEPTELHPPLYTVIDPDALNSLFSSTERGFARGSGRVTFEYRGYAVTVRDDGRVTVEDDAPSARD